VVVVVVVVVVVTMSVAVPVVMGVTVVGVSHRVSSRLAESGGIITFPDDIQVLSG
jgi:hypothetical protein